MAGSGAKDVLGRVGLVLLASAAAAAPATAQTPDGRCKEASMRPAFPPTDANRMPANRVMAQLFDKRIVYYRINQDSSDIRLGIIFRGDGSFSVSCEWRARGGPASQLRDWQRCTGTTDAGGGRDVGTWRVADPKGIFCTSRVGRSRAEECWSIHGEADKHVVKPVSGVYSCWAGNIGVE